MQVFDTDVVGAKIIAPERHADARGFFSETYSRRTWAQAGLTIEFVQDMHSLSERKGTIRGLHFQVPPHAQALLVQVMRGRVFDVCVDLRRGSPSYGRTATAELSAENWRQLFIPSGCAHGFCTLEPHTEVHYKASDFYTPDHDRGICWDDPDLAIDWPVAAADATISSKDRALPRLAEAPGYFEYGH